MSSNIEYSKTWNDACFIYTINIFIIIDIILNSHHSTLFTNKCIEQIKEKYIFSYILFPSTWTDPFSDIL